MDYDLTGERKHEEDLEDLTNRYERSSSSRQSNLKATTYGKPTKLPKIQGIDQLDIDLYLFICIDPVRYVDVGSQMPERKRGLIKKLDNRKFLSF
jgi:hypothetical protein